MHLKYIEQEMIYSLLEELQMGKRKPCQTKYSKEPRLHNTEAAQHLNLRLFVFVLGNIK